MSMFAVNDDGLHSKAMMKKLKIENNDYSIVIFYFGEYDEDKKNGNISADNLSMSCKLNGDELPNIILASNAEVALEIQSEPILRLMDVDRYKDKIDKAYKEAEEVQRIICDYFTNSANGDA